MFLGLVSPFRRMKLRCKGRSLNGGALEGHGGLRACGKLCGVGVLGGGDGR